MQRLPLLLLFALLLPTPVAAAPCEASGLPAPYDALVAGQRALDRWEFAAATAAVASTAALPDGPAARRRDLIRARGLLEGGDLTGARTLLSAILEGRPGEAAFRPTPCDVDPGEVRWWLAEAAVRGGVPADGVAEWERIWALNPTSPRAVEAADRLAASGSAVPSVASVRGRELVTARAASLQALQQHQGALDLLDLLPDDRSDAHRRVLAEACMRARAYQRATGLFGSVTQPAPGDLFNQALATSRLGDYAGAAAIYSDLLARFPKSSEASEASFKLGYLAWDGGQRELALTRFAEHRAAFPKSSHDDEVLWFRGWTLLRLGRLDAAREALAELAAKTSSLAAGGAYWVARIDGMQGRRAAEAEGLVALISAAPDTIYAWWASRTAGQAVGPRPDPPTPDPSSLEASLSGSERASLQRGLALAGAGIDDWAAAELGPLRSAVGRDRDKALALAQALSEAGAWKDARALAMPWCSAVAGGDAVALRLCWPRPGGQAVMDAARQAGLPPMLPFAIMRAESGFDPHIVSAAGARGLMQLMPDLVDVPPDTLFDPVENTRLGLAELASLRKNLADTGVDPLEPLIIAAYNGGEAAVRRWLEGEAAPLDVARWAEEISFSETRRYVRRVLGTLQVYREVYGQ